MVGTFLVRGLLVGILAGVLAFVFAYVFGEPPVNIAIAFEGHMSKAAGEAVKPELVSRAVQSTAGLLTGLVAFGAAVGGIFGLVFAFAQGRLGRLNPRTSAALLGAAGFVVLVLVPQIKYPANPPAVGSPDTIGIRTGFYFALIALSIAASVVALGIGRRLVARFGGWNAALTSVAIYVVAMAVVMLLLPTIDEVPTQFSPTVLWNFRVATIGIHVVLWTTLGVAFGALTERHPPRARQTALG